MGGGQAQASSDLTDPSSQASDPESSHDLESVLASMMALEQDVRAAQSQLRQLSAGFDRQLAGLARCRELVTSLLHTETTPEPGMPAVEAEQGLRIRCFGQFEVSVGARPIPLDRSGKGYSILKYLAVHSGKPVQRDVLLATLWPDTDSATANNRLKGAVYRLRRLLSGDERTDQSEQYIIFRNGCYLLESNPTVWVDIKAFEGAWLVGSRLERAGQLAQAIPYYVRAEALYGDDLLKDDLSEEWALVLREHFRDTYLTILDKLSRYWLRTGHLDQALDGWKKILARDPWREDAYRHLMACLAESGNRALALRWYELCLHVLNEQIGIDPEPETVELYESICAGQEVSKWLVA
ncbi:MAG: winged helix-turn-helix domain-containing protein [Anaerolineae bacterium]|nr:winged helix-turn-helix domain-containing protein [Anaerolineae bacterium]